MPETKLHADAICFERTGEVRAPRAGDTFLVTSGDIWTCVKDWPGNQPLEILRPLTGVVLTGCQPGDVVVVVRPRTVQPDRVPGGGNSLFKGRLFYADGSRERNIKDGELVIDYIGTHEILGAKAEPQSDLRRRIAAVTTFTEAIPILDELAKLVEKKEAN